MFNSPKETRGNPLLTLFFFGYADVINVRKNLRFHVSARRLLKLTPPARAWSENYREPPEMLLIFRYPTRFSSRLDASSYASRFLSQSICFHILTFLLSVCSKVNRISHFGWRLYQPTFKVLFHFFQSELARIIVKLYRFLSF